VIGHNDHSIRFAEITRYAFRFFFSGGNLPDLILPGSVCIFDIKHVQPFQVGKFSRVDNFHQTNSYSIKNKQLSRLSSFDEELLRIASAKLIIINGGVTLFITRVSPQFQTP
jgi:hypothetical protein